MPKKKPKALPKKPKTLPKQTKIELPEGHERDVAQTVAASCKSAAEAIQKFEGSIAHLQRMLDAKRSEAEVAMRGFARMFGPKIGVHPELIDGFELDPESITIRLKEAPL